MGRKMVETGAWLVPQIDYGVPFWGKPPLSMWMTAASFELFGIHEWASRFPSFLMGLLVCFLVGHLAWTRGSTLHGWRAAAMTATMLIGTVCYGSVMTDPSLALAITLSMVSGWHVICGNLRIWRALFFVGLAMGLLAKGPIGAVLSLGPMVLWGVTSKQRRRLIPLLWWPGFLLVFILTVPWYVAAEIRSPGFLQYFLVGEHWHRFTVSGWTGDLYGSGHAKPLGTVWLYAVLGFLPWTPWLVALLTTRRSEIGVSRGDGYTGYLALWLLTPLILFTVSRNLLPTYVLPSAGAVALLVNALLPARTELARPRWSVLAGASVPVGLAISLIYFAPQLADHTQRDVVKLAEEQSRPVIYFGKRPPSAEFYSRGTAMRAKDPATLRQLLAEFPHAWVVSSQSGFERLGAAYPNAFRVAYEPTEAGYVILTPDLIAFSALASADES